MYKNQVTYKLKNTIVYNLCLYCVHFSFVTCKLKNTIVYNERAELIYDVFVTCKLKNTIVYNLLDIPHLSY